MTTPATPRMLGELLVEAGLLSPEQLEQALDEQRRLGRRLGRVLVTLGWLTEQQLVEILGRQLLVAVAPEARLRQVLPPRGVLDMISAEQAHLHRLLPIFYSAPERALSVVMSDPLDSVVLNTLRERHSLQKLRVLLAAEPLLEELIVKFYGPRPAHLPTGALLPPVTLLRTGGAGRAAESPAASVPASPPPPAPDPGATSAAPPAPPGVGMHFEAPSLQAPTALSSAGGSPGAPGSHTAVPAAHMPPPVAASEEAAPSRRATAPDTHPAQVRPPEPPPAGSVPPATSPVSPGASAAPIPPRATPNRSVLLLEPDDRYAQVLGGFLTLEGFTILRVKDAASLERALERASTAQIALRQGLDENSFGEAFRRIPAERLRRLPTGRALLDEGSASTVWLESMLRLVDFFLSVVEDEKVLPKARQLRQVSQWSRLLGHRLSLTPRQSDALALSGYLYPLGELMLSRQGASQSLAGENPVRLAADLVAGFGIPLPVEAILRGLSEAPTPGDPTLKPEEVLRTLSAYLEIRDGSHRHTRSGHEKALRILQDQTGSRYSLRVVEAIRELTAKETLLDRLEGDGPAGLSLVLVDKDRLTLEMLELRSAKEGFRVRTARSGDEALKLMEAEVPDIVIAEISLPKMDGFELLARAKSDVRLRDVPCFLLSGRSDAQYITKGLELGAEDVLVKPLNLDILVSKIRRLERSLEATRQKSSSGVQGSLAELSLFDLLQVLQLGQKTVKVSLSRGTTSSQLFLDQGELQSVTLTDPRQGHRAGRDAFFELCTWEQGTFAVSPATNPPPRNIQESNDFLLMEGMRRADEARAGQGGSA